MTDTPITDDNWADDASLLAIPDFEPHTPELLAARDRFELADVAYFAWRCMASATKHAMSGVRMQADELLDDCRRAPDDAELRVRSERSEARLARQQRREAIVNARGRAARQELDDAAAALRDLIVADLH